MHENIVLMTVFVSREPDYLVCWMSNVRYEDLWNLTWLRLNLSIEIIRVYSSQNPSMGERSLFSILLVVFVTTQPTFWVILYIYSDDLKVDMERRVVWWHIVSGGSPNVIFTITFNTTLNSDFDIAFNTVFFKRKLTQRKILINKWSLNRNR